MPEEWIPHKYQLRGTRLLVSQKSGGLLLDPGMGKTMIAIAAFSVLKAKGYARSMLVIAPVKPMYGTWPVEPLKWAGYNKLSVTVLHGPKKEEKLNAPADIYVINPESLPWYFGHKEKELPDCEVLCVDESTKFKNSTSKRFKLLKKYLHWFNYRWILTGTFCPNGLIDLFGQVYILDRGAALGRYVTHYKNKYFYSAGYGGYTLVPFHHSQDKIAKLVAPMVLKLDAEDYLNMPDFQKIIRPVQLPAKALAQYKQVEKVFITQLGSGTIVAANAAAAGTKCRQMANGAVYDSSGNVHVVHKAKFEALQEIIEETNGHPLLILYEFVHDKELLMEYLGKGAVCITALTGKKFVAVQDAFNAGSIPYLIAHGGNVHGLNIQGHCYRMLWFGVTWNLENFIQACWRLYRQGQHSKIVLCYILVATATLDEHVVNVLDHKQANQDQLDNLLIKYKGNQDE